MEKTMIRTWIGAAAAAGIATVAATGLALAQESRDQQTPETQHMGTARPAQIEKGKPATVPVAGQTERQTGRDAQGEKGPSGTARGQVTQTQPGPNAQAEKPQTGQAEQPEGREREKAQIGQVGEPEKPPTAQAAGPETRQGVQMQSGQPMGQGQSSNATTARPAGNAIATGSVHMSSENASRAAEALMSTGRSQTINVVVNVGAPVPGEVDLLPLPPAIASLVPEFQGYEYVVVNDEIVIVQPSTRVVLEIIRSGGVAEAPAGPPPVGVNLTDAQRRLLLESVRNEQLPEAPIAELTDGETVPQDVLLATGAQRGGRADSDDRTLSPVPGQRSGRSG
jgi:Protein of unknown function (DUF1236)